jgi:ammonium transporter Rh
VINTYLSIGTSIVSCIIFSKITHGGKLDMEIILNASLAGGVIMGANAVVIDQPWGAMLAGFIAGTVAAIGFSVVQPFLRRTINMHDTCGVHNLHAVPGFLGGILSCILAYLGKKNFGDNYGNQWWDSPD